MNLPFAFLVVAASMNANQADDSDDDLYVVSPFEAVEDFYFEFKRLKFMPEEPPHAENYDTREKVCSAVINSPFIFDKYYSFQIGVNDSKISGIVSPDISGNVSSEIVGLEYALHEVVIRNNGSNFMFREYLFPCSAWSAKSRKKINFLISSECRTENHEYRFIFEKENGLPKEHAAVGVATIERPARWCEKRNAADVTNLYKTYIGKEIGRAFCHLMSNSARYKLCALVLNAKLLREENAIRFPPLGSSDLSVLRCKNDDLSNSNSYYSKRTPVLECEATTNLHKRKIFHNVPKRYNLFEGLNGSVIISDPSSNTLFYECKSLM